MRAPKLCILCFLAAPILAAIDLPPAPVGFVWQEIPELKSAFLRPSGWYFKAEKHGKNLAYFISKEDIGRDGQFKTGLSIDVLRKLKKGMAGDEALSIISSFSEKWHCEMSMVIYGRKSEVGCQATVTTNSVRTATYIQAVASPDTNTVYLFNFESPESEWASASKTGETIMGQLAIEGEILPGYKALFARYLSDRGEILASTPTDAPQGAARELESEKKEAVSVSPESAGNNLVKRVDPAYPSLARATRIEGNVKLQVIISKTGTVVYAEQLGGDALLGRSAIAAVKQWQYRPFTRDGQAIVVRTEVELPFVLEENAH